MEGQPLNHELTDRGARLFGRTTTSPSYRLYLLDTTPPKPGLVRVDAGEGDAGAIEVEVWVLAPDAFADFVYAVRSPMVIGRVMLADGSDIVGYLCEPIAVRNATDITAFGGWRAYRASLDERP